MPIGIWCIFFFFVGLLLSIDLFFMGKNPDAVISNKQALRWSIAWFITALLFTCVLWGYFAFTANNTIAGEKAMAFLAGYLIEKVLSIDNLFVILAIFSYFKIESRYQKRVLFYGIVGAMLMRLVFITFGIYLVNKFTWIFLLLGVIVFYTGFHMFFKKETETLKESRFISFLKKKLRITKDSHTSRFFIKKENLWHATPLLLALITIEISDLIFAFDSIPAVFSITKDAFIVFTSNIFAILGLRALYFLLRNLKESFETLQYGIAFILCFVGVKMLISPWIEISTALSLGVIILTLLISILFNKKLRT